MPVEKITIEKFLDLSVHHTVMDVRSPAEFQHAHIPGAFNLPIFTNEQRKIIGTAYKQQSREWAIKYGLDFFGPNMRSMVETAEKVIAERKQQKNDGPPTAIVHCWRGGMRSSAVAWLLDLYGFSVYVLEGGYKSFRKYILEKLLEPYDLNILGGYTGSGKSRILWELTKKGELIVDLEKIANHKGSAFGAIDRSPQPSQEMFENMLGLDLAAAKVKAGNSGIPRRIWIEDESQRIGLINIPQPFWNTMRCSPMYFVDIPFEHRLPYIVDEYGKMETERLVNAILRIKKRLGGLETKTAINAILESDISSCFEVLLKYYDKHYKKALLNRDKANPPIRHLSLHTTDHFSNASTLLDFSRGNITENQKLNTSNLYD